MVEDYNETILGTFYDLKTGEPFPFNEDDLYLFDEMQTYIEIKQEEKDQEIENEKAGISADY